jgi:hypothetical protein
MNIKDGVTRRVFLTKSYAIKIPHFWNWFWFLQGLICNLKETGWYRVWNKDKRLCPIRLWKLA